MKRGIGRAKARTMLVLAWAASLALAGCTVDTQSSVDEMTEAPESAGAVVIDESGDGQSFDVVEGQQIILRLPGNATTGYEWSVASTDRTFGYPDAEQYLADDGGAGSGGTYEFVWSTDRVLSVVGTHTVVMHYGRSWEQEPIDEFTFTVDVIAQDDSAAPLVIDESGNGERFEVTVGTDVLVRLASNPSTGYEWIVASTDRTFGYPATEQYLPDDGGVGSGGMVELRWTTAGPLSMEGSHTVVLEYRRSWESEPAETFTFTVDIVADAAER